jgi:hypothetical protein
MDDQVIMSMKAVGGVWSEPEPVGFSDHMRCGDAVLSPAGRALFFVSDEAAPWSGEPGECIWVSRRLEGGWSQPEPIDSAANSLGIHWSPSVSGDGTVYFGAGDDIYSSRFESGHYLQPEPVGPPVNSSLYDATPFISPDEAYLIFSRIDFGGGHYADLFVSFRGDDGAWTEPVSMGDTINEEWHELCPVVTPDGKYLFFLRNAGGILRPHWVDALIIEDLRPKSSSSETGRR